VVHPVGLRDLRYPRGADLFAGARVDFDHAAAHRRVDVSLIELRFGAARFGACRGDFGLGVIDVDLSDLRLALQSLLGLFERLLARLPLRPSPRNQENGGWKNLFSHLASLFSTPHFPIRRFLSLRHTSAIYYIKRLSHGTSGQSFKPRRNEEHEEYEGWFGA